MPEGSSLTGGRLKTLKKTSEKSKSKIKTKKLYGKLSGYGYILPLAIILISFYVLPIIMSFLLSFTKYNIMKAPTYAGLKNYLKLFRDKTFLESVKNTFIFMIGVVPIQTIGAMLMATWLNSIKASFLGKFVKGAMFVPVISSMILTSIIWRILLNGESSPLNLFVGMFGFSSDWLGDTNLALYTLMGICIWKNIGYFMILYTAGLMDIPKVYYEAAQIDGANKIQEFFKITIPQLKKTTIIVVFLGIIWSFQIFDLVYSLTGGGPGNSTMTMVMHIYNVNFKQFNTGYAMAIANVLFLINAILAIAQKKFLKVEE